MASEQVRLASLDQLRAINERGIAHDFNKLLCDRFLDGRKTDEMFAVQFLMEQELIAGQKTDLQHYRCLVSPMDRAKQQPFLANLDMTPEDFDGLPTPEALGFRPFYKK